MGQVEAESGLIGLTVGVCGEGGAVSEGGGSGFVGVESSGAAAAAAASGAVKDGACETGWISRCPAQRGRSGAQKQSVAASGGGRDAASAAPAVGAVHCYPRSVPQYLHHRVCPLKQLRQSWMSERASAPACPKKTPQSSV